MDGLDHCLLKRLLNVLADFKCMTEDQPREGHLSSSFKALYLQFSVGLCRVGCKSHLCCATRRTRRYACNNSYIKFFYLAVMSESPMERNQGHKTHSLIPYFIHCLLLLGERWGHGDISACSKPTHWWAPRKVCDYVITQCVLEEKEQYEPSSNHYRAEGHTCCLNLIAAII